MLKPIHVIAKLFDMEEDEVLTLLKNLPGKNFVIKNGKVMADPTVVADLFEEHGVPMPDDVREQYCTPDDDDGEDAEDDE